MIARVDARSPVLAKYNPTAPTMRIETTPRRRSINTDATACPGATCSCESPYARTMSPPMLAGRNVPANVLTKKIRSTEVSGGRELASIGQSSTIQRYAISIRSSDDERNGHADPRKVGMRARAQHRRRAGPPEDVRGEQECDEGPEDSPDGA